MENEEVYDGKLKFNNEHGWEEAYLPSNCPQNHAANLLPLPNGDLLCTWFSGTQEGISDISVYMSRLNKNDEKWTVPVKLSADPERSEQNPVLFLDPDERLWLMYTAQKAGNQDTAIVRFRISEDYGYSWGEIKPLFDEPGTFIRQPITVLDNGEWLLPVFRCFTKPGVKWVGDYDTSAVKISADKGATWKEYEILDSVGCVHMNINKLKNGTLMALFRSRWADHIYRSVSVDQGRTWSAPEATELPNNNSSIQFITLQSGNLALVFNNVSAGVDTERRESLYDEIEDAEDLNEAERNQTEKIPKDRLGRRAFWGTPRAPMCIALSEDNGETWPYIKDIQVGDGYCLSNNSTQSKNREFSYPSIKQSADGFIHVAFTYFRQTIKYVKLEEPWIKKN